MLYNHLVPLIGVVNLIRLVRLDTNRGLDLFTENF